MESEDKSVTSAVVQTETAVAGDLALGAGVSQKTGNPPCGAGASALVELESEEISMVDTDNPSALGKVGMVSDIKSMTTAMVQTETPAAGDLVLGTGVPRRRASTQKSPRALPELMRWSNWSSRKFSRRTSTAQRIWGWSSWSPRKSR